jgi:carbon monoxide dehydrogenase subunit G
MEFENRFDINAPIDRVWSALLDVERVAPAVPGARVLERTGEDAYKVAIKIKVGPMSMTYNGDVEIREHDDEAHRAVMKARATESRGQGTANADVTMTLTGEDGRTSATVNTTVQLRGKVAGMGQGVLKDVSGRLVDAFAQNLATMLEGGEGPEVGASARPAALPEPPAGAEPASKVAEPARKDDGAQDALDLGSLGGQVVADELRDPRRIAVVIAVVAFVFYGLGRHAGRR